MKVYFILEAHDPVLRKTRLDKIRKKWQSQNRYRTMQGRPAMTTMGRRGTTLHTLSKKMQARLKIKSPKAGWDWHKQPG